MQAGPRVVGIDVDQARVEVRDKGSSHVGDLSDDDVAAILAQRFPATTDPGAIAAGAIAAADLAGWSARGVPLAP